MFLTLINETSKITNYTKYIFQKTKIYVNHKSKKDDEKNLLNSIPYLAHEIQHITSKTQKIYYKIFQQQKITNQIYTYLKM